ncbi:MAG: protein BatD [Ketobacter sp.]|nr:protein BatD [Ketobacter sp.]
MAQSPGSEDLAPPDFFIEAEIDNLTPYVGQQITYGLRRYQAVEFPNQPYYKEYPFPGFWSIPLIQRPSYTTTISGREYKVHPTFIALFAHTPGTLTIDPAKLIIPNDDPEDNIILESEGIKVLAVPLPDDAPAHFRGAVGQYEIKAWFDADEGQVGKGVSLIVEIKGSGNIETLIEPGLPPLEHWTSVDIFGAQITSNIPLSKEMVKGTRQFKWLMVPQRAGQQFFPAIRFSYFDPETKVYRSIRTDPLPITVAPDTNTSTFVSPLPGLQQEIRRLVGDIRHIKPVPTTLVGHTGMFQILDQSIFWGWVILPLLAVGGIWFWQWWRQRQLADTPQARRWRARNRARKLLSTAPNTEPYTTVRHALTSYLSDKLNQPVTGLTSDQLIDTLTSIRLNPQLTDRIQDLLAQVDAGRFAPLDDKQAGSRLLIENARTLIDDLEKFFSKRGM